MKQLLLILVVLFPFLVSSQWNEFTSHPFSDTLWSVSRDGNRVLIAGNEGVLYSSNALGSVSEISDFYQPTDAEIYNRSKFYGCYVYDNDLWICGRDTVNNQGVVFYSDNNSSWRCKLQSSVTTKFVDCEVESVRLYCVGENGYAQFNSTTGTFQLEGIINANNSENYTAVTKGNNNKVVALSDEYFTIIDRDNGPIEHYERSNDYDDISRFSWYPVEVYVTRKNNIFKGEEPFNSFEHINAISDVDTFNCVLSYYGFLAGSNDGIYYYNSTDQYGEKFVGTEGYYITDVHAAGAPAYVKLAVGANGTILWVNGLSGPTFPFVGFDYSSTYCLDSLSRIDNLGSESYSYEWFLDNNLIASTYDLEYTFTTPGYHTIKLVGSNGTLSDSLTKGIWVVSPPAPTIAHSVSDSIVCHEGTVDFTFDTESGINYALMRSQHGSPDTVFTGNGGSVTVSTDLITDTTYFELYAGYPSTDCYVLHELDTIFVQKPKAQFHATHLNQDPGGLIYLYDNSLYSDTSEWILNSNIQHVNSNEYFTDYSTEGFKDLGLIAITDFGCRDTLIEEDVIFITDTSIYHDGCFDLNFYQKNTYYSQHHYQKLISDMITDNYGNIYLTGTSDYLSVPTKQGQSPDSLINMGFFIAKYNKYGVLKWMTTFGLDMDDAYLTPSTSTYRSNVLKIKQEGSGDKLSLVISQSNGCITNYKSNDGEIVTFDIGSVPSGGSDAVLQIDSLGRFQKLFRSIEWYTNSRVTGDIDKIGNIYAVTEDDLQYYSIVGKDSLMGISAPQNHKLGKIESNGNVAWSLETDFLVNPGMVKVVGDKFYVFGHDFGDNLFSTDGTTIIAPGSTATVFSRVLVCYDTSGVLQWHYKFPYATNGNIQMNVDEQKNLYLSLYGGYSDSIVIVDPLGNEITTASRLIKFSENGTLGFHYTGILSNNNFTTSTTDVETWDDKVAYLSSSNGTISQQLFPIAPGSFDTLMFPNNLGGLYYGPIYNENGILLDSFFIANDLNTDPINDFLLPTEITFNENKTYYASNISLGITWRNTYYPTYMQQSNGEQSWLLTNSLDRECGASQLLVEVEDTVVCRVDSTTLNITNNILGLGQFASENVFYLETSDTPQFNVFNSTNIDSISNGNLLSNIPWSFNYSQSTNDTIWLRLRSTLPEISSNLFYIVFEPEMNDTTYTKYICKDDSVSLVASYGETYSWYDESQNIIGNSDSIVVFIDNSDTLFEVNVVNACGVGWSEVFEVVPTQYIEYNTDSVSLCPDIKTEVEFLPNYHYQMNGNTSTVDSITFSFEFNQDTLIEFMLLDSIGCSFDDSIQFLIYPTQPPNLNLVGPPWEIVAPNTYMDYFWYSNSFFNNASGPHAIYPSETGEFFLEVTDSNGCVTTNSYYFSNASIENNSIPKITIYPNPVDEKLNFSGDYKAFDRVEIISLDGRVVFYSEFTSTIDIGSFASGSYLVILSNDSEKFRYRIVKK